MKRLSLVVLFVFLIVGVVQAQTPAPSSDVTLDHTGILFVKQVSNVYGNVWVMVTYGVEAVMSGGALFLVSKYFKLPVEGDPHFALLNREQIFLTAVFTGVTINCLNGFFNAIAETIRNAWNMPADQKPFRVNTNGAAGVVDL